MALITIHFSAIILQMGTTFQLKVRNEASTYALR